MPDKITIDLHKCIGCQTCVQIDPQVFTFDQTTFKAKVKTQNLTAKTKKAIAACPVDAISIKN